MSVKISLCDGCAHWTTAEPRCKAFPGGIPDKFLLGDEYHTTSVPGDAGIVFVARNEAWQATAAEVLAQAAHPEDPGEGEPMP
jgi:hypothetical protein